MERSLTGLLYDGPAGFFAHNGFRTLQGAESWGESIPLSERPPSGHSSLNALWQDTGGSKLLLRTVVDGNGPTRGLAYELGRP